jgi:ribulose-phosphate 3-epimerase
MIHKIVPGVLAATILDIRTHVGQVIEYVPLVQLDICDGLFVQNKTWPYSGSDMRFYNDILNEDDGLPYWNEVNYELDLMVKDAHKKFFTDWIKLGPTHMVFHVEAESHDAFLVFLETLEPFYKETVKIGLAIETQTDIEVLRPFIPHISYIQCMGIDAIGKQGEPFSQKAIEQIKQIQSVYPEVPVTVDGGVNERVLKELAQYNLARYVVGSALFRSFDTHGTISEFENIVSKDMVE